MFDLQDISHMESYLKLAFRANSKYGKTMYSLFLLESLD